jgi:hypothetical protein
MAKNAVQIQGVKKNINGNVSMLFAADDITSAEKIVLRSYLNTTASIAGCQQIRKKIGASCFGFRVVHGECIFVTVSPNRRHSSMVLKMSRARRNDVGLTGQGATSKSRRRYASATEPSIFCSTDLTVDPDGREVEFEVPLPPMCVRQGWRRILWLAYTIILFSCTWCCQLRLAFECVSTAPTATRTQMTQVQALHFSNAALAQITWF